MWLEGFKGETNETQPFLFRDVYQCKETAAKTGGYLPRIRQAKTLEAPKALHKENEL
jgi:hypothetical protein